MVLDHKFAIFSKLNIKILVEMSPVKLVLLIYVPFVHLALSITGSCRPLMYRLQPTQYYYAHQNCCCQLQYWMSGWSEWWGAVVVLLVGCGCVLDCCWLLLLWAYAVAITFQPHLKQNINIIRIIL